MREKVATVPFSPSRGARRTAGLGFDWIIAGLSVWFMGGLYLDGWAHLHVPQLETFFTPWHGVLYSGYFAIAAVLLVTWLRHRVAYGEWSVPSGYKLSLVGAAIFAVGGIGDMVWHMLFGIEANLEALLSPTHLILAIGGGLMGTGPLRAAWRRRETGPEGLGVMMPMLISLTLLLSAFNFFTEYVHPFGATIAARSYQPDSFQLAFWRQAVGITGVLLETVILMSLILLVVRRWALPFGSLTFVLGFSTMLLSLMRDFALSTGPVPLVAVALVGGMTGDVLIWLLKPSEQRPEAFRLFAFAFPAILYALYFVALAFTGGGIWWSIHLWGGVIALAGIVGWLLSYLVIPPLPLSA